MTRRRARATRRVWLAASDVYKRQGPICSAVMWNEVEHLGVDHSKDEHVAGLIEIVKS